LWTKTGGQLFARAIKNIITIALHLHPNGQFSARETERLIRAHQMSRKDHYERIEAQLSAIN